jgi:hypothetical protein
MAETEFASWPRRLGISMKQAAELLGKSYVMAYYLDRGMSPGGPCVPQRDTRMLMTVIAQVSRHHHPTASAAVPYP